jgi:hypothetical protein
MTKTAIISIFLIATSTLFSQVINANFEEDKQGWTSHQSVEWTKLFSQLSDRGGLSFSGENPDGNTFLFIQKEITKLKPNTNYRIVFNMNWVAWLDASASPIIVKVGATNQKPTISEKGREFIVAGQLTPDKQGRPFLQNVQNYNNVFFVNTDRHGRLFLVVGIETPNEIIEKIYINTVRGRFRENGEARVIAYGGMDISTNKNVALNENFSETISEKISEITTTVVFVPNAENDLVFFKSDYNNEIEMVNIYTEDNHLMKFFSFRNPSDDRAFQTKGLTPGPYRIEFLLSDGRVINEKFTVK